MIWAFKFLNWKNISNTKRYIKCLITEILLFNWTIFEQNEPQPTAYAVL